MKADNSHSTPKSEDGKGFNPSNHPTPMEKLLKSLTGATVNHLRVTLTVAAATAVLIAAVVIVCVLTAAFLFGDTSQPATGEKTLSAPDSTIQSAPIQQTPVASSAPEAKEPAVTMATESSATEAER